MLEEYGDIAKAFYRRGTAYMGLHEYCKARADLKRAALLEPKSKDSERSLLEDRMASTLDG